MKHKIFYLPIAVKDLQELFDYIYLDKPSAARDFLQTIDQAILKLSNFPELGTNPRDSYLKSKGYRILIANNYLIFYLIKKNIVEIHRILHGKRKYQFLF